MDEHMCSNRTPLVDDSVGNRPARYSLWRYHFYSEKNSASPPSESQVREPGSLAFSFPKSHYNQRKSIVFLR